MYKGVFCKQEEMIVCREITFLELFMKTQQVVLIAIIWRNLISIFIQSDSAKQFIIERGWKGQGELFSFPSKSVSDFRP